MREQRDRKWVGSGGNVNPMQRSTGSTFAGYRIDAVAGRGGMGIVYRATQIALGRTVALKLIAPGLAHQTSYRERFTRELRAVASLDHPNVIPIYHAGEEEGQLYVAMRWVEGTDLDALVARHGRLAPLRSARIVDAAAAGLDAAHASGLVHRDVKPGNILIAGEADNRIYLSDFGLSKHSTSAGGLTAAGHWVGTPDYVSPEQIRGVDVGAPADVYSLGCVLFHTLTGEAPFPVEGDAAKLWAHMTDPPPSVRERVPSVPEAFDEVVRRAMAKNPGERYASAGELGRAALDALESGERTALDDGPRTEPEGEVDWHAAGRTQLGGGPRATDAGGVAPATDAERTELGEKPPVEDGGRTEIGEKPVEDGGRTELREKPVDDGGRTELGEKPVEDGGRTELGEKPLQDTGGTDAAGDTAPQERGRPRSRLALLAITGVAVLIALGVGALYLWDGGAPNETGPASTSIAVGDNPTALDFGAGAVWVANYGSGTVTRIDPSTNKASVPIEVGDSPEDVSVGEGGVWVSNAFGALTRIEPRSNEVADEPIQLGADPYALAAGGGSVWVASGLQGTVTRVDPEFNRVVGRPIRVGSTPTAVAVGGGSVWVGNSDSATVTRIDARSGDVVGDPVAVGRAPMGLAVGGGAVWVANSESNSVTRIDPRSGDVIGEPIAVGRAPVAIAVAEGAVWVANSEGNSVTRIDPRSGEVVGAPIAAGPGPTAVTAGGGAVWVTNSASNRVTRIDR